MEKKIITNLAKPIFLVTCASWLYACGGGGSSVPAIVTPQVAETPMPTATPVPEVVDPPAVPEPTTSPMPTDEPIPEPTVNPVPTGEPMPEPTTTPVPTDEPMPEPTTTPVPTDEPAPEPTATPDPSPAPTPAPTVPPSGTEIVVLTHDDATYSGGAENTGDFGRLTTIPSAMTWRFQVPVDGQYRVTLQYSSPDGSKVNHFAVDGASTSVTFASADVADHSRDVDLRAGEHTATLSAENGDWGYMNGHGLKVELVGALNITSPANLTTLPSGSNITVEFDKTGGGDILYTVNGGEEMRHSGTGAITYNTSGDDIYQFSFALEGTAITRSLRVVVGTPESASFVTVDGMQLMLDGKPWYFSGTNQYYLMFKPKPMANDFFERVEDLGMNTVRSWMFCHNTYTHDGVCVNRYDGGVSSNAEDAKEHFLALKSNPTAEDQALLDASWSILDNYVAQAELRGIKLVLALGDNWPDNAMGSLDMFAKAVGASGISGAYANAEARELYKMWVTAVLNHVNTITGVAYKDDPTIAIWELGNEPRCTGSSGCAFGSADYNNFNTWVSEISAHIKSIAPNQLVSIGTELDNNDTDAFVEGIHEHDSIDLVSAHIYPKPWGLTTDEQMMGLVQRRIDVSRKIGKPLYYGEFSFLMEPGSAESDAIRRASLFEQWYDLAYDNKDVLVGMMSWQLSGLEWGNGLEGSCQWCSGAYGAYSGGWYGNHDGYQFYCTLNASEESISSIGARGTNVEGSVINLDWHKPTCDAVREYSESINTLNNQ